MEVRNIHYGDGFIDCELNHPMFGWVPFTASPEDPEEHGRELYSQLSSMREE